MSRNLLLLGVAAALCLLAGEALLRARGFGRPLRYEWDERLAWRMAPDQHAHAPSYGGA